MNTNPSYTIEYVPVVDMTGAKWTAKIYNTKNEVVDTVTEDSKWSCEQAAEKLVNWLAMKRIIKGD